MWARVLEIPFAIWLALSPFIFRYDDDQTFLWANDLTCATIVLAASLLSFKPKLERMHLVNLLVALWLIGIAFVQPDPPPPAPYRNYVVMGLLLAMVGILPSRSHLPPRRWREYYEDRG